MREAVHCEHHITPPTALPILGLPLLLHISISNSIVPESFHHISQSALSLQAQRIELSILSKLGGFLKPSALEYSRVFVHSQDSNMKLL